MKNKIKYWLYDLLQDLNRYFWNKATDNMPVSLVPVNNFWYTLAFYTNRILNKLRRL